MAKVKIEDVFGKFHEVEESEIMQRVSAYGVFVKNGKILLIQDVHSDFWEFPGGGLEEGENLEEGLKREFLEETGLEISEVLEKVGEIKGSFYHFKFDIAWNGHRNFFLVKVKNGGMLLENGNNNDTKAARFFKRDDLENLEIKPQIKEIFLKVLK